MSSIFFHAVVRVSELKCLRCLLFHAPMTVNAYSNPIKPVGGLKMFDYFYLAWIVYKCKLQCKRSLYTNTVIKTNNFFCLFVSFLKVTIKTNTTPSLYGLSWGIKWFPVSMFCLSSVTLFCSSCLAMGRGSPGSLADYHGPDIRDPLQLLFIWLLGEIPRLMGKPV